MEVVIAFIIILFCAFGTGYYLKRKIYKEVDRLEAWKIDIMNQSIINELAKLKKLKMIGQTEELFERWRKEWDEIITSQLPEVEELLFDAEDYADKYRFRKAKATLIHIESILKETELQIEHIINEINHLISSEKDNSQEAEEAKQLFKKMKKGLIAHAHVYGKAQPRLEEELNSILEGLKQFDVETESGNYLIARDILSEQKDRLSSLQKKMEEIPKLLSKCQTIIPQQIQELRQGYLEMKEKGYPLNHIEFDHELKNMNEKLIQCKKQIEEGKTEGIKEGLEEINEMVETLYDMLEKEVYASHFVKSEIVSSGEKLNMLLEQKKETEEETMLVKQTYQLSESEIENLREIEKKLNQLKKQYEHIVSSLEQAHVAHTVLKEELEEFLNQLESTRLQHEKYREMLHTLRKDELEARDKVKELKRIMLDIKRTIQKSNVPGVPVQFLDKVDDAQNSLEKVIQKLEEIPLDMQAVQQNLDHAVMAIENLKSETEEMIEQVYLIEKVIQYGNRYRSRNKLLASKLTEAEKLFRNYEYTQSLEQAAAAIEEIEPGAIERIQKIIEEDLKNKE